MILIAFVFWCATLTGCVTWDVNSARRLAQVASWGKAPPVSVRKRPRNPLESTLNLVGRGGPQASERTQQVLRRYDLADAYEDDADSAVDKLFELTKVYPSYEIRYAAAELAYIRGEAARRKGKQDIAAQWFTASLAESYHYLFDDPQRSQRNAFDPAFRQVCDLYNQSLEGMLRILDDKGMLVPNKVYDVSNEQRKLKFAIRVNGRWRDHNFSDIQFVSDMDVKGLANKYRTFGLGVPLIAVRESTGEQRVDEEFYPQDLTMPMTAFFQVSKNWNAGHSAIDGETCVLELFDPLEQTVVEINGQQVPLESDISTPLAYYLKDPLLNTRVFDTLALIDGEFAKQFRGLYMLEPFDPDKIPVILVHGLWSSPITWTDMYNDLRADPSIRENYQFWFYLYPSGQPFWVSARQMRADLAEARATLDPSGTSDSANQTILIGHSMGGLVSRLQTMSSHNEFWSTVSKGAFSELQGDPNSLELLEQTLFFNADPSVQRVITLATPHQGSNFANSATKWISHRFFRLPSAHSRNFNQLVKDNPDVFDRPRLLTINTSVDSLAPDSPFFEAMASAERAPWVRYHNIVGDVEHSGLSGFVSKQISGEGDGVVGLDSARTQDSTSEISVPAGHTDVHQHPRSILEVRRILLEHLAEQSEDNGTVRPVNYDQLIPQR